MDRYSDDELFSQTVPVFIDFAPRLLNLAEAADRDGVGFGTHLVPDTFSAGEHLVVAQDFILRTLFPVMGRNCPELGTDEPTLAGIFQRHAELLQILGGIDVGDFTGAAARQISHVAGEVELTQNSSEYVRLFGIPNFFFHLTMGYASFRAAGAKIGKAQFDGLHDYSPGFSFID